MKRTRRTLSLVALLLVAVTLLSSCGINFRKTDVSKYVTIGDTGFKGISLEVNRTKIQAPDIDKELFLLQYSNRTAKKDVDSFSGKINQYDTLALRLAIYDDKNNLVFSQFGLDSSKYNTTSKTVAAVPGLSFDVGYGELGRSEVTLDATNNITLPVDILKGLEEKLRGADGEYKSIDEFRIEDRWKRYTEGEQKGEKTGAVDKDRDTPVKGFFSIDYEAQYTPKGGSTVTAKKAAPVTVDTYLYEGKEQGQNDFLEAIYLGLLKYEEKMKANGLSLTCEKTFKINVVPADVADPDLTDDERKIQNDLTNKEFTDQVLIKYNLNFADPTKAKDYTRGTITTTILFAYANVNTQTEEAPDYVDPIELTFTPDENYKGKYTVAGQTTAVDMAKKTFTIRVYVESRTAYDMPEQNAELIKKSDHAAHMDEADLKGTDEDVVKNYRKHLMEEMQKEADKAADADAKEALWAKVLSAAQTGKKSFDSFAKRYVKEQVQYLKYVYYDYYGAYSSSLGDTFEEGAVNYVNYGFESQYTEMLKTYLNTDKLPVDEDKSSASYKAAYRQLESVFYKEGLAIAKERALTYLMADKLDVRFTEDQLEEKLDAAVKKANEDAIESIRDAVTVDADETEEEVKKSLVTALTQAGASESKIKNMALKDLARNYLLQYYGVSSLEELPKEMVTRKSYLSQVDKESLFGGYQLEVVKNKLFELNESTITFVTVDTDGNKIEEN